MARDITSDYRPDIDGLRAIAVVAVLLYHLGFSVPGGFVGVDVFFVISGFLITSIVSREISNGTFTYVEFWQRRIRRLVPALAVMVTATVAAGYFILLPNDFKELGQSVVAQTFALSNFYFCREQGYFDGPSELKPLLHTWSLSVEEQFYLLMPALLIATYKLRSQKIIAVLITIFVTSLGWCIYSTSMYPAAAFYLIPTRAWELSLGAIIAVDHQRGSSHPKHVWAEVLSLTGLSLIFGSLFFYRRTVSFPGWFALLPCLGAALIIKANANEVTLVRRFLSFKLIVFVGLISYSLYLWHWPVIAFATYLSPLGLSTGRKSAIVLFSLTAAVASWFFIEIPFRKRVICRRKGQVFTMAASSALILSAVGLSLHRFDGFSWRCDDTTLKYASARSDRNPYRRLHHDLTARELARPPQVFSPSSEKQDPRLAVIGDSHADAMMPGIVKACLDVHLPVVAFTRSATLPLIFNETNNDDSKSSFFKGIRRYLSSHPSIKDVFLIARWTKYSPDKMTEEDFDFTVGQFRAMGIKVWVVLPVVEPKDDVPRFLALNHWRGINIDNVRTTKTEYDRSLQSLRHFLGTRIDERVCTIDLSPRLFDEKGNGLLQVNGNTLFIDNNHLTRFGALWVCDEIRTVVASIKIKNGGE